MERQEITLEAYPPVEESEVKQVKKGAAWCNAALPDEWRRNQRSLSKALFFPELALTNTLKDTYLQSCRPR